MRALILAAAVILIADQASKLGVVFGLELASIGRIEVWPGVLEFRMAWNKGINFGLFATHSELTRWGIVAVAVLVSAWLIRHARGHFARAREFALAGILVGGALGNAIDRILHGAVADFLNVSCCGIVNPYSFNVADAAIFIGALGLLAIAQDTANRGDEGGNLR